jgi:hypothetical protein
VKTYTRMRKLDPCDLTRDQLIQLSDVVKERVSANGVVAQVTFTAKTPDMEISSEDLNELLASDDLPPNLRTLAVCSGLDGEVDPVLKRSIELKFTPTALECTVKSSDSHWVRGTFEEVMTFLRRKRPKTWALRKYFSVLAGFSLGALIGVIFTAGVVLDLFYVMALVVTYFFVFLLLVLHQKGAFFPYSDIHLTTKKSLNILGWASFVLALIGTGIAVAGFMMKLE